MTYELAKQLKDSGFPQNQALEELGGNKKWIPEYKEWIDIPTLSELIEACGEGFKNLSKMGDKNWGANNIMEQQLNGSYKLNEPKGYGSTPEESVARLWLALQG